MDNEMNTIENWEIVTEDDMEEKEPEMSGTALLVVAAIVTGGIAVGVWAILRATKKRREARAVEKLRQKGYLIQEPEDDETDHECN